MVSDAPNAPSIFSSSATLLAIVVGGVFELRRIHAEKLEEAKATVAQKVTHDREVALLNQIIETCSDPLWTQRQISWGYRQDDPGRAAPLALKERLKSLASDGDVAADHVEFLIRHSAPPAEALDAIGKAIQLLRIAEIRNKPTTFEISLGLQHNAAALERALKTMQQIASRSNT